MVERSEVDIVGIVLGVLAGLEYDKEVDMVGGIQPEQSMLEEGLLLVSIVLERLSAALYKRVSGLRVVLECVLSTLLALPESKLSLSVLGELLLLFLLGVLLIKGVLFD
jgi:hypothetical protein